MVRQSTRRLAAASVVAILLVGALTGAASSGTQTPVGKCPRGQEKVAGGDICVARGSALGRQLLAGVRDVVGSNPIRGAVFGVWVDGKTVLTGALGEALPDVPAVL